MGVPHCKARQDALASGAEYYFTGKPCRHGHTANRYTKSSTCVECARERARRFQIDKADRYRSTQAAYRQANGEALLQNKRATWAAKRAAGIPRHTPTAEARSAASRRYYEKHRDKIRLRVTASRDRFRGRDNAISKTKKERKRQAVPLWADLTQIRAIYEEAARLGMHVDHHIPLRHPLVCGLHVQGNLRLLTPVANMQKRNRFDSAEHDWKAAESGSAPVQTISAPKGD